MSNWIVWTHLCSPGHWQIIGQYLIIEKKIWSLGVLGSQYDKTWTKFTLSLPENVYYEMKNDAVCHATFPPLHFALNFNKIRINLEKGGGNWKLDWFIHKALSIRDVFLKMLHWKFNSVMHWPHMGKKHFWNHNSIHEHAVDIVSLLNGIWFQSIVSFILTAKIKGSGSMHNHTWTNLSFYTSRYLGEKYFRGGSI